MKERPILFSAPMVRAILDGSKTMTRRVWKMPRGCSWYEGHGGEPAGMVQDDEGPAWWHVEEQLCPYGIPGDRLWVRETFAIVPRTAYARSEGVQQTLRPDDDHDAAIYRAGWDRSNSGFRWRPSIHMPRWASRILLEITDVRVEKLQDISEADARAEGVTVDGNGHAERDDGVNVGSARTAFAELWESINGADSWAANPWVWVVEFKRVETTEGER